MVKISLYNLFYLQFTYKRVSVRFIACILRRWDHLFSTRVSINNTPLLNCPTSVGRDLQLKCCEPLLSYCHQVNYLCRQSELFVVILDYLHVSSLACRPADLHYNLCIACEDLRSCMQRWLVTTLTCLP